MGDPFQHRIETGRAATEHLARSLERLCAEDWRRPTAFTGWEVADLVAHLSMGIELYTGAIEGGLRAEVAPLDGYPAIGSPELSAYLFQAAIARRGVLGERLLPTFVQSSARFESLARTLGPEDWDRPCYHPEGVRPARALLAHWLIELAIHAWDIEMATGVEAAMFAACVPVFVEELAVILHQRFRPGFRLQEPFRYRFVLSDAALHEDVVIAGDEIHLEASVGAAHALCRSDAETLALALYGRRSLEAAVGSGRMTVEGDPRLVSAFSHWF